MTVATKIIFFSLYEPKGFYLNNLYVSEMIGGVLRFRKSTRIFDTEAKLKAISCTILYLIIVIIINFVILYYKSAFMLY